MSVSTYESLGVLAAALYGDVFKLRHRATGDLVALKRMDMASASRRRTKDTNRPIEEDVFAEIQTNLKLRKLGGHPHVVAMRDCFADENSVSIVTEFCARGELLDVVNARGALLPVEDVLRYFHQIAQGVAFLHANGVAHRDLSLENVLVDDFDCCKLSDFGMATTSTRQRATGIGKVQYMAPEACLVEDDCVNYYNPFEADVWSLGVILITLLTGQYPFQHALETDSNFVLLRKFGVEYLLERCNFDTEGYEDVVDILRRMLAVDPSQRATAAELLEHECFDEFSAVDVKVLNVEEDLLEVDIEEQNPAHEDEGFQIGTPPPPTERATVRNYGVASLFAIRRPSSIETKPSCTFVPSISARKSPAAIKEQRSSVIALTPKLSLVGDVPVRSRPHRRSPKCRKKGALRGMLDGVFRRKKARAASSIGATK